MKSSSRTLLTASSPRQKAAGRELAAVAIGLPMDSAVRSGCCSNGCCGCAAAPAAAAMASRSGSAQLPLLAKPLKLRCCERSSASSKGLRGVSGTRYDAAAMTAAAERSSPQRLPRPGSVSRGNGWCCSAAGCPGIGPMSLMISLSERSKRKSASARTSSVTLSSESTSMSSRKLLKASNTLMGLPRGSGNASSRARLPLRGDPLDPPLLMLQEGLSRSLPRTKSIAALAVAASRCAARKGLPLFSRG